MESCCLTQKNFGFKVTERSIDQSMNHLGALFSVDQPVNRPNFAAKIHIKSAQSNESLFEIDAHIIDGRINYANQTLQFRTNHTSRWEATTEYYITLDEGVLFSNASINSTEKLEPNFWHLKVTSPEEKSTAMTTVTTDQTSAYLTTESTSSAPKPPPKTGNTYKSNVELS